MAKAEVKVTIELKVKEKLYRLWRDEFYNDNVYMCFDYYGNPVITRNKENAFKAPLEEIKKWITPAWKIEEVD